MAIRKRDSYDEVKHLLMSGLQAECLRAMLAGPSPYPLRRKREAQLDWVETGPEEYRPYNVIEMHIHVGVRETELYQRIQELERDVEQLRDALENLVSVPQPSYLGLSREQRLEAARMRVAHQLKFAQAIGKSPADLVEELTSLFPMSDEESETSVRED